MSAYGTIKFTSSAPVDLLPPTTWDLQPRPAAPGKPASPFRRLVTHHLRLDSVRALSGLLEYTHRVFAAEIEEGRSYPQEEGYVGGDGGGGLTLDRGEFEFGLAWGCVQPEGVVSWSV